LRNITVRLVPLIFFERIIVVASPDRVDQQYQALPIIFRISAATLRDSSGLAKNRLSIGISLPDNFNCPDTMMILIVGQSQKRCAPVDVFLEPGRLNRPPRK
jgi:hypothetical protein